MTPARILAICRDEWPALRWRWFGSMLFGFRRGQPTVWLDDKIDDVWVYDPALGAWIAAPPFRFTERGLRSALREARRLVAS